MDISFHEQSKLIYKEYIRIKDEKGDDSAMYYLYQNPIDPQDFHFPNELDFYYLIESEKHRHMCNSIAPYSSTE